MAIGQFSRLLFSRALSRPLLLTLLPLFLATSINADNSLLNPQPNFSGIAGGGVTANAGNCFLGDASAAQGAIGGASAIDLSALGAKKKPGSSDASGCQSTAVPDSSSLSCDSAAIQDGDGNFDPKALQAKLASLSLLDGKAPLSDKIKGAGFPSLTCEKDAFNSIKTEMACVQNQGQLLAQQIGSLAQVYQQNITRYQKDDQAFKQREGDRQAQLDTIQKLLGGNKDSGTKGLLGEQADLQKIVNDTMPQDIAKALADSRTVANQRAILLQQVQKHTMSLTGDCFKTNAKAGYKCTPGGADLSPENYIVCMYGKYAHVKNGQYVQGALADSNATAAQNTLQGILDQMTSMTALSYSVPTDPNAVAASAAKPSYGNTIQDLLNNFVSKTAGMTVNGISVQTTITNELQSCYLAAQAEVQSERTDPTSVISMGQFQQTQSEAALKAGFDQKLEQYSQKWTEAMGVLSSQNLPLNLSNCKSQDVTYEGNCLTDVQNQLTSLLKGDATQVPFTMSVPAQFPDTQIPTTALQCRGINGCVTQLQAVNQQVTQAKTTLTTQRGAYETQARQSTDQFTQQVAALMSSQSAQLRKQLAAVNSKLQGLGVSGNISFPNVQSEKMEYETNADGSQGLPKVPDDVMKLIGGKVTPPLMDLTDNSNNDGSGVAEGVKKVNENLQKVETVRSKWEGLASSCAKSDLKDSISQDAKSLSQCLNVRCALSSNGSSSAAQVIDDLFTNVPIAAKIADDDSGDSDVDSDSSSNNNDDDDGSTNKKPGAGRVKLSDKDKLKLQEEAESTLTSLQSGMRCDRDPANSASQKVGSTGMTCAEVFSSDGGGSEQAYNKAQAQPSGNQQNQNTNSGSANNGQTQTQTPPVPPAK